MGNFIKEGEVCIFQQPSHTILSVVVVEEALMSVPLPQKTHDDLPRLEECSDVFFVFQGSFGRVDLEKFVTLYGGIGYVRVREDIVSALFSVFQYAHEIFETPLTYALWKFEEIEDKVRDMKKVGEVLQRVTMSDLKWPLINLRRLSPTELAQIYLRSTPIKEKVLGKFLEEFWAGYWWGKSRRRENLYTTYTSESVVIVFKRVVIERLLKAWEEEREWIETFKWADYRKMLASLLKHIDQKVQLVDVEELWGKL